MRRLAHLAAKDCAMATVSAWPTASKIIRPGPISPVTRPTTVTRARLTRCRTALIAIRAAPRSRTLNLGHSPAARRQTPKRRSQHRFRADARSATTSGEAAMALTCGSRRGLSQLARQQTGKLRDIVGEDGKNLCAFGQVLPVHVIERVGLRVVHLVIVCNLLHAP